MHRLRASDRSPLKRLAAAALAVAAATAPTLPVSARVATQPAAANPPSLAAAALRCPDGSGSGCARQLLVGEIVVDDRAGPPTVLIRARWQTARSPELMRLSASLREACGSRPGMPCGRTEPGAPALAMVWGLAAADVRTSAAMPMAAGVDAEPAEQPLDLLLGGPWSQACEIGARGSSCPQLEPAQARLAAQTAQRQASYAVLADIQRRPGWGEALLVRLTRQLE